MNILYDIESLKAGYSASDVLRGISCKIGRGEFVSIIGPNGAGKSTLVKSLCGFMKRYQGKIDFCGEEIAKWNRKAFSRRIAAVFPREASMPAYTVHDFVSFGLFPAGTYFFWGGDGASGERLLAAMRMCGIEHLAGKRLNEISDGEFQLSQIARALVQKAEALILDEPVSHLDPANAVRVMDTLYRMHNEGVTIIAVLHDLNLALSYSERIIALKAGEIVYDGPAENADETLLERIYGTRFVMNTNSGFTGRPAAVALPAHLKEKNGP